MAEGIEVTGALLDNGLLHIDLARPQPEIRVKSIPITRSGGSRVVDAEQRFVQAKADPFKGDKG